ncbi:MAG: hypothetical protein U1F43_30335 [Myxococcota bacterium]
MRLVLALTAVIAGCQTTDLRREVHVHEQALLLPDALGPAEPRADRVTILQASGRTRSFDDVVIGRDGDEVVVTGVGAPVRLPLAGLRAVQIDRDLVGSDRRQLEMRDAARPDVQVTPGWGIVLGVVAVIAGSIIVVTELQQN